jgi:hypothetical protein
MDIGWSVHEMAGGGSLLHGSTAADSTNDDIFLARLDAAGNIRWQKTYGNEKYERTTQLLPMSDGHYVLIGQRNIGPGNIDSYIFKVDSAGTLVWEKTFGDSLVERTYYGAETAGGDLLIMGSVLPHHNTKADILLVRLSPNGDLKWKKTYGEAGVHEIGHSFLRNRDNRTFTLTGYTESGVTGIHDGLFMQLDENGKLLTRQHYAAGGDLRLMHSEETRDGNFISTGFFRMNNDHEIHDAVLACFDSAGKLLWKKTYGNPALDDQGYWVLVNPDGGYTWTGFTHSQGRQGDLWIVRTDPGGN